jgi:hypothetical protein
MVYAEKPINGVNPELKLSISNKLLIHALHEETIDVV